MPIDQSSESENENELSLTLIGEDIQCEAERSQLGFFTESVDVCAQEANNYSNFFLYDPSDGECIYVMTESAECVEGLVSSPYYDFYEINANSDDPSETETEGEGEQEWTGSFELIAEWTRCDAEGYGLGYFFPAEECAQACVDDVECMFFMHDSNDGECIAKMTESADCPEGLADSSYYDFYMIQWNDDVSEPSEPSESSESSETEEDEWEVQQIAEYMVCQAESQGLGYYPDINECAQNVMEAGSMFFNFDPNDGECSARFTNDASCPERLESHGYFHWYQIVWSGEQAEPEGDQTGPTLISEGFYCEAEVLSLAYGTTVLECADLVRE